MSCNSISAVHCTIHFTTVLCHTCPPASSSSPYVNACCLVQWSEHITSMCPATALLPPGLTQCTWMTSCGWRRTSAATPSLWPGMGRPGGSPEPTWMMSMWPLPLPLPGNSLGWCSMAGDWKDEAGSDTSVQRAWATAGDLGMPTRGHPCNGITWRELQSLVVGTPACRRHGIDGGTADSPGSKVGVHQQQSEV